MEYEFPKFHKIYKLSQTFPYEILKILWKSLKKKLRNLLGIS